MRRQHRKPGDDRDPGRSGREIGASRGMRQRSKCKTRDQKDRIILADHCERRGASRGSRPERAAGLERAQEAPGGERPDHEQHGVGVEALGVELIGRRQHQKQQHQDALVPGHELPRDQVDEEQRKSRIRHRHQLQRPVAERKDRGPGRGNPAHQRRMLVIAPGEMPPQRPGLERIGVQPAAGIGDGEIQRPDRDEADQEQWNAPARLDAIKPAQQRQAPSRRRAI